MWGTLINSITVHAQLGLFKYSTLSELLCFAREGGNPLPHTPPLWLLSATTVLLHIQNASGAYA